MHEYVSEFLMRLRKEVA